MTDREILETIWRRSILDGAECRTVEQYAERVAARLLTAYGDVVDPATPEAVVTAMRARGLVK